MGDGTQTPEVVQTSVAWVREKVDPEHTLPEVILSIAPDNIPVRGTLVFTKYAVTHEGEVVGEITVNTDKIRHICWTNNVRIDEKYRGKGLGLSTYITAIEQSLNEGNKFRTHDWSQTPAAKRIWDILVEKGAAKVIEPFVPDGHGRFSGHCEVKERM